MNVKLAKIASVQSGIVLSRKEAKQGESTVKYTRLTLRAVEGSGRINTLGLEKFSSKDILAADQLTREGDVVTRLFAPIFPTIIERENVGMVVPSQLALIRLQDKQFLPEYIQLCLSRRSLTEKLCAEDSYTHRSITVNTISNLQIPVIPLDKQKMLIEIHDLAKRREQLYRSLIEQESLYTEFVIDKMIGGFSHE